MKNVKKKITIVTVVGAVAVSVGGANVFAATNGNIENVDSFCISKCINDGICNVNNVVNKVKDKTRTQVQAQALTATPSRTNGNQNCDVVNCTEDSNCGGTGIAKHDGSGYANGTGQHNGNGQHNGKVNCGNKQ